MGENPVIGQAPYFIVVAEQKVLMHRANVMLGHCLQNRWRKATTLGLGFQPPTRTEMVTDDRGFCDLLGIPFGENTLDDHLGGYPDTSH